MRRVSSFWGLPADSLEAPRGPPGVRGPQVENPCTGLSGPKDDDDDDNDVVVKFVFENFFQNID